MAYTNRLRERLREETPTTGTISIFPIPKKEKTSEKLIAPKGGMLSKWEINTKLLWVALSLAVIASLLALFYLKNKAGLLADKSNMIEVVVASQAIPAGTKLQAASH